MATNTSTEKVVPIGVVLAVVGYVILKVTGGLDKLLSPGDVVNSDDHLLTGEDGELTIGFLDGTSLSLGSNAETLLDSDVFDQSILQNISAPEYLLEAMQQAIMMGQDPQAVLQAMSQGYEAMSEGGFQTSSLNIDSQTSSTDTGVSQDSDSLAPAAPGDLGSQQPIGGDTETHSLPEMLYPHISIASISILEPQPGKGEEEDHESEEASGGHEDIPGGSAGHDTEGHDTESHDTTTSTDEHATDHDAGGESGYSAGHGGGYGYAGGSLFSTAVFTVTLSSAAAHDVRVDFKTIDGTAISGGVGVNAADYGSTSGTLLIPAGESTGTIEVTIYSDKLIEGDEQFYLTLSNPVNAILVEDTAIGTIIDSGHGEGEDGVGQILIGTNGDDVLITKGGADVIYGQEGNDTLISGGGPDEIHGGEGDDMIVGLGGPDKLYGDAGNDEIIGHGGPDIIDGGEGDDIIYAGGAPDQVSGGPGDDFINAEGGPDTVDGGPGNDIIFGGGGPDTLNGGTGNDTIRGEGGPDILRGGPGDDQLFGGGGPDILIGGEGTDSLKGGESGDVFRFENLDGSIDRIVDFTPHDQIDISSVLDFQEGNPITNYVQLTPSTTDASSYQLSINPTGSGSADDFQVVAILENMATEPDVDQLLTNGNLIVIE